MGGTMKFYNVHAANKSVKLCINSDLVKIAKNLHLNLSKEFECHLIKFIRNRLERKWVKENKQAISEYNQSIQKRGLFSEESRCSGF
jgi:post-segregation antitoxin (ccd killing protein)